MDLHFQDGVSPTANEWWDWRWQLAHAARSVEEVASYLGVGVSSLGEFAKAQAVYPLFVTPYYLSLVEEPILEDPIFRQCFPDDREVTRQVGGDPDALSEEPCSPVPRLVHRYPDRALLVTGNCCAMHCRHCMRKRDWSKPLAPLTQEELGRVVDYLTAHPEVREVLVSGGDPLMLPEANLRLVVQALSSVNSVEILRFGSRVPCTLPQKVSPRLASILASGKTAWLACHFNHPRELTKEVSAATDILNRAGVCMVNQSVLLKGVNDNAEVLGKLFTSLLKYHIKPYYLFHGDPIEGAMHFRTGVKEGLAIMDQLRGRISGMALPAFAFDLPGGKGKIRLQPETALGCDPEGNALYRSWQGEVVAYPDQDGGES